MGLGPAGRVEQGELMRGVSEWSGLGRARRSTHTWHSSPASTHGPHDGSASSHLLDTLTNAASCQDPRGSKLVMSGYKSGEAGQCSPYLLAPAAVARAHEPLPLLARRVRFTLWRDGRVGIVAGHVSEWWLLRERSGVGCPA